MYKKYDLGEYVHFLGSMTGELLDKAYNESDIAVSSLGMYNNFLSFEFFVSFDVKVIDDSEDIDDSFVELV